MLTPVFDFMLDFILGALITCDQNRYTAFQIKLKYPLVSLIYNVFIYLLLDQNYKLFVSPNSCSLDVARFLDPPRLNV